MPQKIIKTSYNSGELSGYMDGRTDINKYHNGASKMINATVLPHGGFVKRPGTAYIATAPNKCKLFPFEFSVDDSLILEFSNLLLRFYKDGAVIFQPLATEDLSDHTSNIKAHWKLNDNAATTTVVDADGATHNGVLYEGDNTTALTNAATDTDGADGTNRSFDMSQLTDNVGAVVVTDHSDFTFGDGSDDSALSLHAWVKYTDSGARQDIITKWLNSHKEWELYVNSSDKIVFRIHDNSANTEITADVFASVTTVDSITAGSWVFIVATYSGTGGDAAASGMKIYVDWVLADVTSINNASYVAMEDKDAAVMIGGANGIAQSVIDPNDGLAIGDMDDGGDIDAAFDGTTSQAAAASAAKNDAATNGPAYIGKDWGSTKTITGFKAYGSNDEGFCGGQDPTVTVTLQGSSDNFVSDENNLGNTSDTDANSLVITKLTGITATTAYRYHRLKITHNQGSAIAIYCAEAQFYDTGGATWTGKIDNIAILDKELSASEISDLITAGSTTAYSIISPYTSAQAFEVHTTQSADVMYLAHKDIHPKKLSRLSDTSWTLEDVPFTGGPFLDENITDTHLVGFARTGGTARSEYYFPAGATGTLTTTAHSPFNTNMVGALWLVKHTRDNDNKTTTFAKDTNVVPTLETFASGAIFIKGDYTVAVGTIAAGDEAQLWRKAGSAPWQSFRSFRAATTFSATENEDDVLYAMTRSVNTVVGTLTAQEQMNRGIVKITAYTSSTVVSVEVVDKVLSDNSTDNAVTTFQWAEGAWSDYRGFPRTVTFFEDRLWWSSSANNPDTLWSSKSALYENMEFSDIGLADDALIFPLNDNEVSQIQWMFARQVMAVGAANKEYRFGASDPDKPVTPSDRKATPQTSFGSDDIQPIILNDAIFFFQRQGRKLMAMKFDSITENFVGDDATLLAYDLFISPPTSMAVQRVPDSIIWTIRTDGIMPTFTYEPLEEVAGWSRQIFGNSSAVETPTGFVESVAVIHGSSEDEVWVSVRRVINSSTVRYIERFKPRDWGDDIEDAFFVDSGVTYDSTSTTAMTGLGHLIGETVAIFADGLVQTSKVVNGSGEITLETAASVVQMGLPYTMKVRTMRLAIPPSPQGTLQTRIKRIHSVVVRFIRSLLGSAGQEYGGTEYLQDLEATYSTESQDTSEDKRLTQGGFSEDAYVTIVSSDPVPFTALSTVISFEVEERR